MSILAEHEFLPENEKYGKPSENKYPFVMDKPERARREVIKVVAVGGGGGNAINHVISKGIEGVELLAVNTDARSLDMSLCKETIILGEKSTKGLGAGAVPEIGEIAARESLAEIRSFLRGSDMVYFTAGMGGGTGTGALPVIAAAAKEMGILTVAVVTKPFAFEGSRKRRAAEIGIEKLRDCVDALIVVPNDRLLEISNKETPLSESFSLADEILRQAVLGVTNLITRAGMVNVDFADLKTVMKESGSAVMGVGNAHGENRISKALAEAVESPLMECSMSGARGVLMNISCGNDLGLYEVYEAASYIENLLTDDATFIWGCIEDPELEGKVEIVIVATGIERERPSSSFGLKTTATSHSPRNAQQRHRQETLAQFENPRDAAAYSFAIPVDKDSHKEQEPATTSIEKESKPTDGLVPYLTDEEKPHLISETGAESGSSWITTEPAEVKLKASTDKFDAPAFTRQGKVLHDTESS